MKKFKHSSLFITPEPPWNSIKKEKLPEEAYASIVRGSDTSMSYHHHWVRHGKEGGDIYNGQKRYIDGKLLLHKGGLIESYRQAIKNNAPKGTIDHLEEHLKEAGIDLSRNQNRENIYKGIAGDMTMKKGKLPVIGGMDLNRIIAVIDATRARSGDDLEDWELTRINNIASADLKKQDIFAFPYWLSSDRVDSFSTRMDPDTTLPNYVEDFCDSRALMLTHAEDMFEATAIEKMPLGNSFHAEMKNRTDREGIWVKAWSYILRGIEIGSLKTDDAIRMITGGVWNRLSVAFTLKAINGRQEGYYLCEICNNKLMSSDCDHLPGRTYDGKLCIARIIGASARESSLAYLNSSPGTVVMKARMLAERGDLEEKEIKALEAQYGCRFFHIDDGSNDTSEDDDPQNRGINNEVGKNGAPETKIIENKELDMEQIRAIMLGLVSMFRMILPEGTEHRELGELKHRIDGAADEAAIGSLGKTLMESAQKILNRAQTDKELVEALPEEKRTLEAIGILLTESADGVTHRKTILDDSLSEGVRYEGESFDADHWRGFLGSQPLDVIEKQGTEWKKLADSKARAGQNGDGEGEGDIPPPDDNKDRNEPHGAGLPDVAFDMG